MEYVKTTMIESLLNAIAPHRCSSCGQIGAIFCVSCKYDTISEPYAGCILCTKPCGERGVCPQCVRASGVTQAWCVGERREGLKRLMDAYKFDGSRAASTVCTDLLDAVIPELPTDTFVVGIPSAPGTIRVRGFDHMGRIVTEFAKRRGLQIARPLERASTTTLHFLPRKDRISLSSSLFRLSGEPVPETVLVLDDIVTTGTTLRAATTLLKNAGAKRVYVAAIARQPNDSL